MELREDVGDMVFDGALGQDEFLRDLAITCPLCEQPENFDLSWAQFLWLWRAGRRSLGATCAPKFDQELVGNLGLDGWLPCIHLANSRHQFISGDIFEEIAHSTSLDSIKHILFVVKGGEDNDTRSRIAAREHCRRLHTAHTRHLNI